MCPAGVSNEGHSSSKMIGPSNDCNWLFSEVSLSPWCNEVVHFEVLKNS